MIIGGFQKISLIDFPKTIACIVFTQGCNFFCPYCHNPDLVAGSPKPGEAGTLFDEKEILTFLEKRKGFLEGVVITGGEPTLQKDLKAFCKKVKEMGYRLKMDTNGSRPDLLKILLKEKLLDFVSMDIKTSLENYSLVAPENFKTEHVLACTRILMESAPAYEFRTTCARPFISRAIIKKIGEMIHGADQYILQKCSENVNVLDPQFPSKDNAFFSDADMLELKQILERHVSHVVVR